MTRSGNWSAANTNHQCPKGQNRARILSLEEACGETPDRVFLNSDGYRCIRANE